jgi:hypothetical protein
VVAAGILNLETQMKNSLPCTNVCISGSITGKVKANIQNKIKTVNDILKRVSDQNKWTYIDNTNLDLPNPACLYPSNNLRLPNIHFSAMVSSRCTW